MKKIPLLLTCFLLSSCSFINIIESKSEDSSAYQSEDYSSEESSEVSSFEQSTSIIESSIEESSSDSTSSISEKSSTSIEEKEEFPLDKKNRNYTYFLDNSNDVYRINITSKDNVLPGMDKNYVDGYLSISSQDQSKYILNEKKMKFKLRGNSTLAAPKKAYKVKFSAEQSLFGLEASTTWVLLANYFDKSNIRNYLAYLTANKLTNLDFQPSSIFVDVYINNEYNGLYLLCEQMEVAKGRVDIAGKKSKDGILSTLLEVDDRAVDEYAGLENVVWFRSSYNSHSYMIRPSYPDVDDFIEEYYTKGKTDSILSTNFINSFNYSREFLNKVAYYLSKQDNYEKYLDVDSFIDMYILQEVFKNVDYSSTSMFMYIDTSEEEPKLKCGPAWDFDIAAGVVAKDSFDYQGYASTKLFIRNRDFYYHYLFKDENFVNKLKKRYSELRYTILEEIISELKEVKSGLQAAFIRNINKWPLGVNNSTWIEIHAYSATYESIPTMEGHFTYLKNWLINRLKELDEEYLIDESGS